MKKFFLKSLPIHLLLGVLLTPFFTQCADQPHALPLQAMDQSSEPLSPGIDATYATKNLLSSIMEKFPHLTVPEALSRSALLGIISETEVQLHMYGTFSTKQDPHDAERTIKIFDTDTPLNKVTRAIFDVLDEKLRPTVLGSNPFVGLNGKIIAKMMLILTKDGIQGLINALEKPTPPKKKTRGKNGEEASVKTEELSLLDEWWESYQTSGLKRLTGQGKFLTKILGNKKDSEEEAPFIKLLKEFASNPTESAHPKEDLAKILMTFLCLKNQSQKTTGESHALKEYYTTLLEREFTEKQYTRDELDAIKKALTEKKSSYEIGRNPKGLEDITSYLAHFSAGDVAFLNMPYGPYYSATKNFSYCAEATTRSIMNSILYNPKTRFLDRNMLPTAIQEKINPRFLQFIQENSNPAAPDYYGKSLEEWLNLVSGVKGVAYMQGSGEKAYEMDASPEDLVTMLNHIFGTKSDSLEAFGKAISVPKEQREIVFAPVKGGFHFQIQDNEEVVIDAHIEALFQGPHSSFTLKRSSIVEMLHNSTFRSFIIELSDYAKEDLYGSIFMNKSGEIASTPLQEAIKNHWSNLVKSMLACGTDPNFKGSFPRTPLEEAILAHADDAIDALLYYGAHVTDEALSAACKAGNLALVKKFIPILEKSDHSLNYTSLLFKVSESQSPSIPLVEFLISKGANLNEKNKFGETLILNAIKKGSLILVKYLAEHGVLNNPSIKKTAFQAAIRQAASKSTNDVSIVEYLIFHGATLPPSEQTESFIDSLLLNDNARLIRCLMDTNTITAHLPFDKTTSLLSLAIKQGKFGISQFLIQDTPELLSNPLLNVIASGSFSTEQKIQLTKSILEKVTDISTAVLEEVKENLAMYEGLNEEELGEEDKKERKIQIKQWRELLNLLEQAQAEQLFGLNLTTQEQKCITECIMEAA